MNDFEKAMNFRHACKLFDENQKIPRESMDWIMEMGRLSPSSFGLEPWRFLVIEDQSIKAVLRPACWDQPQVTTCSHFVVLLSKKPKFFEAGSEYLKRSFLRRTQGDEEKLAKILAVFDNFQKNELKPDLENWAKMQVYLASANMMSAAAFIGIDSCPIEGFVYDELEKALAKEVALFKPEDYGIAYCIAFGYRAHPQGERYRWAKDEVITYV
ncbi:NAD(P)H-dependent oxidoreductase [Wolinella succinogenes]|uniref:NAD(P)H-dependent oxidoreductase n=1 Tax=Wolinella succinogenes TaxID=844 RepID=UPI00240A124B|nr:NAD(P)H-dependent oxidoreductase [Wolinella succinogenes]